MFCGSVTKIEKYDLEQCYAIEYCFILGRALPMPAERFRKRLVSILYHVLKYFGGTKTL
jgi:hypothetical protein